MKTGLFYLLLVTLWLAGCQKGPLTMPVVDQTSAAPVCDEPGRVLSAQLDDTARGYPYHYRVYLPPCYDSETGRLYPVLYLIPGRSGGPGNWFAAGVDQTADELILNGQIPPLIIVTTESIDADGYAENIFNDLLPAVERRYRIQADRAHRAVAGGSLGGVGAYRLAFRHPGHFGSAGIFGSGLISGEEEQARQWLEAIPPAERPRLFFNCGQEDSLMLDRAQAMIALLDEMSIQATSIFSQGEHTYAYWVSNFPAYLRWLAQEW
ncbi:MAG TPA: alpha/beta hydrolase-fold protein [Anaerolineae bacterium]